MRLEWIASKICIPCWAVGTELAFGFSYVWFEISLRSGIFSKRYIMGRMDFVSWRLRAKSLWGKPSKNYFPCIHCEF
jgi:hypothetical protein